MTSGFGEVSARPEGRAVHFERYLGATPEEVWAVLTEPERMSVWLQAKATFEPHVGGAVTLDWEGSGQVSGMVSVFEPPRLLEYSWLEGSGASVVRFELQPEPGGVRLLLDHRDLPAGAHAGVGAGWHTHLDGLAAMLSSAEFDFWARFHELEPEYEKRVASL